MLRTALEQELSSRPRPPDDADLLTSLLAGREGVLTLRLPDDAGGAALYFSSPLRAADYRENTDCAGAEVRYLRLTLPGALRMLRDLEKAGISHFCLDRCPRCDLAVSFGSAGAKTPADLWGLLNIHAATQRSRGALYLGHALAAARAGRMEEAREVALETAGHVTLEEPDVHLLLGRIGVASKDTVLVEEAGLFLQRLGALEHARVLARESEAGSTDFAAPPGD